MVATFMTTIWKLYVSESKVLHRITGCGGGWVESKWCKNLDKSLGNLSWGHPKWWWFSTGISAPIPLIQVQELHIVICPEERHLKGWNFTNSSTFTCYMQQFVDVRRRHAHTHTYTCAHIILLFQPLQFSTHGDHASKPTCGVPQLFGVCLIVSSMAKRQ